MICFFVSIIRFMRIQHTEAMQETYAFICSIRIDCLPAHKTFLTQKNWNGSSIVCIWYGNAATANIVQNKANFIDKTRIPFLFRMSSCSHPFVCSIVGHAIR